MKKSHFKNQVWKPSFNILKVDILVIVIFLHRFKELVQNMQEEMHLLSVIKIAVFLYYRSKKLEKLKITLKTYLKKWKKLVLRDSKIIKFWLPKKLKHILSKPKLMQEMPQVMMISVTVILIQMLTLLTQIELNKTFKKQLKDWTMMFQHLRVEQWILKWTTILCQYQLLNKSSLTERESLTLILRKLLLTLP